MSGVNAGSRRVQVQGMQSPWLSLVADKRTLINRIRGIFQPSTARIGSHCLQQPAVFHVKLPRRPQVIELKPSTVAGDRTRTLVEADFPRHPPTKLSTTISTTCTLEPRGRHGVGPRLFTPRWNSIGLPGRLLGLSHYFCPRSASDGLFLQQPARRRLRHATQARAPFRHVWHQDHQPTITVRRPCLHPGRTLSRQRPRPFFLAHRPAVIEERASRQAHQNIAAW